MLAVFLANWLIWQNFWIKAQKNGFWIIWWTLGGCRFKFHWYQVRSTGSISILLFLKFPTNKCSLLDRKSNIAKSQFLKIWFFDHFWANYNYGNAKTSIRGCTSAQIKTLRPYFSIFSITVVRICLRKQHSKLFTTMLSTPSIEPVNIWFDPAATCI